jgi:Electron transfer DM13
MGIVVVAGGTFVLFWFQPQKLWIDDRVDEPIPVVAVAEPPSASTSAATASEAASAAPSSAPASTVPPAPVEPVEVARGDFVSLDHGTRGVARVLALADGSRVVRLEGLDTSNGPDLYLYVTSTPATGEESTFDDEFVNLGRLKGNQGDQNYELPPDTDLTRFATVLIWCDRFNSAFGAADLVTT